MKSRCVHPITSMLTMLACALAASEAFAVSRDAAYAVNVDSDVVYGLGASAVADTGYVDLLMDVYSPVNCTNNNKPAVLIVHGGQFRFLDKSQRPHIALSRFFAARGFVAFCIDYRQVKDAPLAPEPFSNRESAAAQYAALTDCKAAVRWIRANAARYGIDPGKIAGVGSSAGGTCMYGLAFTDSDAFAVASPSDPAFAVNNPDQSAELQACVALWGNPSMFLREVDASATPILIVHGLYDPKRDTPITPIGKLQQELDAAGAAYELHPLDVSGHALWEAVIDGMHIAPLALDFFIRQLAL